jgi:hypothetical protein
MPNFPDLKPHSHYNVIYKSVTLTAGTKYYGYCDCETALPHDVDTKNIVQLEFELPNPAPRKRITLTQWDEYQ